MDPILAGRGQKLKCVGLSVMIQMVRDQEKISMFTCTWYKMMHENSSAICNGHTQGLSETNTVQENML